MSDIQIESAKTLATRLVGYKNKRHGHTCGTGETPEYSCWCDMKRRCISPKRKDFKNYGGRGIRVCERWLIFENFFADMGTKPSPAHSIERRDNDGNYCTENCYWATRKEQRRNTSRSRKITFEGKTLSLFDWADLMKMSQIVLQMRLKRGWTVEKALTRPLRPARLRRIE